MNHFWIVSLVLTKQKHGGIDIVNLVDCQPDVTPEEAVGKVVLQAQNEFADFVIAATYTYCVPVNSASTMSTPVNNP